MSRIFLSALLSLFISAPAMAWDSTGHRISAAVALEFLEADVIAELMTILAGHPRYQDDFISEIPDFINRNNEDALNRWLLGQAAYWPDIARGLPEVDRERFNRPWWHYIDGSWVRDSAAFQGNVYVDIPEGSLISGKIASDIALENDVSNVVTAIDYNSRVLVNVDLPLTDRAIALCWVLHLMGDIHQPLHAGSLFTASLFETGDRGGNALPVAVQNSESNLHALWDSALAGGGVAEETPQVVAAVTSSSSASAMDVESDWTQWLNESRQILRSVVYTPNIVAAIRTADRDGTQLSPQHLSPEYISSMREISRQRLGLAGLRMSIFFSNELPH